MRRSGAKLWMKFSALSQRQILVACERFCCCCLLSAAMLERINTSRTERRRIYATQHMREQHAIQINHMQARTRRCWCAAVVDYAERTSKSTTTLSRCSGALHIYFVNQIYVDITGEWEFPSARSDWMLDAWTSLDRAHKNQVYYYLYYLYT